MEVLTVNAIQDGPASSLFSPIDFGGEVDLRDLDNRHVSPEMLAEIDHAHGGDSVAWGIPFRIRKVLLVRDEFTRVDISPTKAAWFVFLHTSDTRPDEIDGHGFVSPMHGIGKLGEHAADYVFFYGDGSTERASIRRRYEIGTFDFRWGENCTRSVPAGKPRPIRPPSQEPIAIRWGRRQKRAMTARSNPGRGPWTNYLWAFENPHPEKAVTGLGFEPKSGTVIVSAVSAGHAQGMPLRWGTRRKAVVKLPRSVVQTYEFDEHDLLDHVQLDLGQVISATPRLIYPNDIWAETRQNRQPTRASDEVIVEFTAHDEARFHLSGGECIPVARLEDATAAADPVIRRVPPATQRVRLRVVETGSTIPVPVKLHVHGADGEYLPPLDRHRMPNPAWFEDYGADLCHGEHTCVYIPGEISINLPLGNVFLEVTKGFEIAPIRKTVQVTGDTRTITIELDRVLDWRTRGWVTADTHVHFLSPGTAMLEGAAEGVNVVNLLASQWGELMTNVGDFDGKSTFGTREAGGDGEHLVRVGTENRQHVLGHISLIGYRGTMISPLCTGGPDESALGDPVEILISEWAKQCRDQGGLVVLPHFPDPRLENAATLVLERADAVEMCSQDDFYHGIDPYSLSDWYRYLNNGYLVPAVGGTDKMGATWAVGTIRTYARLPDDTPFTYDAWMEAVRNARTFVTYGPLLEFAVDGREMGRRMLLTADGGTVDVTWTVASATVPMTRVELIVNGEIRESRSVKADADGGYWSVHIDRSAWLALLVRAKYEDKPEMIAAHSTPVMVEVEGSPFFAAADALTILEQIEGAMAYLDTIGTRAESKRTAEMRLLLQSAYRRLHNRMHEMGFDHPHSHSTDHPEHH